MTRFDSRGFALAISLGFAFSIHANAEWSSDPSNNLSIADADNEQVQPKIVATSDGGFYVSWFDNSSGGYDVRLQRLDALGALSGDDVMLCLRDSQSSCLIKKPDSDETRHVIMPLRL